MKKIVKRFDGGELTVAEALSLCEKVKSQTGISYIAETAVQGYPTADMAIKATLAGFCETYSNYVFAFAGTINRPFEGYKAHVIVLNIHPADLEAHFQEYVVLG